MFVRHLQLIKRAAIAGLVGHERLLMSVITNTNLIVGQRIAARRTECKMTQAALAIALGLSRSRIAQIEGGADVTEHVIGQIAGALGTSASVLYADIGKTPMTEVERDKHCLRLARAAAPDNALTQAYLMLALGCVPSEKPKSKTETIIEVGALADRHHLFGPALFAILEFIKGGQ